MRPLAIIFTALPLIAQVPIQTIGASGIGGKSNLTDANRVVIVQSNGQVTQTSYLHTDLPRLSIANTYTAGMKQSFQAGATNAGFRLVGVSADPSSLEAGDVWYRSDLGLLRLRDGSATSSLWKGATAGELKLPASTALSIKSSADVTYGYMTAAGIWGFGPSNTSPTGVTASILDRTATTGATTFCVGCDAASGGNTSATNSRLLIKIGGGQAANVAGLALLSTSDGELHRFRWEGGAVTYEQASGGHILWSNSGSTANNNKDIGIRRVQAGILGIFDGVTTTTYRDILIRNIYLDGTTSSFPLITRNGSVLRFRLGDDSGYTAAEMQRALLQQGTITSDASGIDHTVSWNAGGVTFTGIKSNVTDTASAAASLLMDLQVGGSSRFKVEKGGVIQPSGGYKSTDGSTGFTGSSCTTFKNGLCTAGT